MLSKRLDAPQNLVAKNGAVLIGKLPNVGPKAYLHEVFRGVDSQEIESIENESGLIFPGSFKEFLLETNGLILFQGALAIYGIRSDFDRGADNRQPFDVLERNVITRPRKSGRDEFFIGSYNWDGSLIYMKRDEPEIYRRLLDDDVVLSKWKNLDHFVSSEIERISGLFDKFGNELDENNPTTPGVIH